MPCCSGSPGWGRSRAASRPPSPRSGSPAGCSRQGRSSAPYAAAIRDDDDAELVAAAQRGERDALERLLERHYDRVHAICRRMTGNDADALDATQEALLALVRGLARFDGSARFSTWAYRVTTNACLDELRRRSRRPRPIEIDLDRPGVGEADTPAPEDAVVARHDVDAALAALPEDFRAAVVLRDLCDLDYAEIAAALGVPIGTVRSRIARGRAALAAHLGGNRATGPGRPT